MVPTLKAARHQIRTGRGKTLRDRAARVAYEAALEAQDQGVHPDVVARILVTFADALESLEAETPA